MGRRKLWWAIAVFTAINAVGALFAELMGDSAVHTGTHLILGVIGIFFLWRVGPKRVAESPDQEALPAGDDDRMTNLERSIEAVAVEVERIGEGQRFMDRLIADQNAAEAAKQRDVKP